MNFIKGNNNDLNKQIKLNEQINKELKVNDNKSELVIFTLIMPYLLYSDINYNYNIVYNTFVLKLK